MTKDWQALCKQLSAHKRCDGLIMQLSAWAPCAVVPHGVCSQHSYTSGETMLDLSGPRCCGSLGTEMDL